MRSLFSALVETENALPFEAAKPGISYTVFSANIQNAGLVRLEKIAKYLRATKANVIVLTELQAKPVIFEFLEHLRRIGYQGLHINDANGTSYHTVIGSHLEHQELVVATETLRDRTKVVRIDSASQFSCVYFVGVYGPSFNQRNFAFRRQFKSDLEHKILNRLSSSGKNAVIMGDLNVIEKEHHQHLIDFATEDRHFFASLTKNGFVDVVRSAHPGNPQYTWISPRTGEGQKLDHLFACGECVDWISNLEIVHEFRYNKYSDHSAIRFRFTFPR